MAYRGIDRLNVAGGYRKDDKTSIVDYINQPAVILVQEGKTRHRRSRNVHKVYVAYSVINYAVYVECKEHNYNEEFKTVKVILNIEL